MDKIADIAQTLSEQYDKLVEVNRQLREERDKLQLAVTEYEFWMKNIGLPAQQEKKKLIEGLRTIKGHDMKYAHALVSDILQEIGVTE